ncbi:hypothetical protein CKA32_002613 [Geitlerinema sp. FC II]|nr:hypothetical protein CKA32_002613 [Geitlerinema sp. FC II]
MLGDRFKRGYGVRIPYKGRCGEDFLKPSLSEKDGVPFAPGGNSTQQKTGKSFVFDFPV